MLLGMTFVNGCFFFTGMFLGCMLATILLNLALAAKKHPSMEEILDRWRYPTIWRDPIVNEEHDGYLVVKRSDDGIILDVENFQGDIIGTQSIDIHNLSEMVY